MKYSVLQPRLFYLSSNFMGDESLRHATHQTGLWIRRAGHQVISRWHEMDHIELKDAIDIDLSDLELASDLLLIYTNPGIGKWVEYGYFLGLMRLDQSGLKRTVHIIGQAEDHPLLNPPAWIIKDVTNPCDIPFQYHDSVPDFIRTLSNGDIRL